MRITHNTKAEVTLSYMKEMLPKSYRKLITQSQIDEINKLVEDPDYGEEFRETIVTAMNVLGANSAWSLKQYVSAVKYFSLTAAQVNQVDSYCRVFPGRLQARLDRGEGKQEMRGEAARFNQSSLVNAIRSQAMIPIHLVNQGNLQLGINTLVDVCTNSRSDMARASAATTLLKELRPPETQHIEMQIGQSDEVLEAQAKQTETLISIAENQQRLLASGASITDIQQIHVTTKVHSEDAEVIDE